MTSPPPAPTFAELPPSAAWWHVGTRAGFEVVFAGSTGAGWRFEGHTTAVDEGRPWAVHYEITVDERWRTRDATVAVWSEHGHERRRLTTDGDGRWQVDGAPVPALDGCLDVDLEASACTNTFPVHRLDGVAGGAVDAPAAYVRVAGLVVERLEQRYASQGGGVYDYEAPRFDFRCTLRYDRSGLVVDYPGIATRVDT
jgi:hypothetical protein